MNEGLGEVWFVRANARRNSHCVPTHDRTLARPGRDCTFLFAANGPQGRRPGEQDLPLAGIAGKCRGAMGIAGGLRRVETRVTPSISSSLGGLACTRR
jgi:hypothetical protein